MVKYSQSALDATFGALADPIRRAILARLAQGQAMVTELAEPFRVSLPAVSKHVRVLESAGLLEREVDGRIHRCRLAAKPMRDACVWIERYRTFWESQFDSLARYLESTTQQEQRKWHRHSKVTGSQDSRSKSAVRSLRRAKRSSPHGPSVNS
jgi:DNA-binding transcriptional ArsR family regulator